jgi:anti-sigma factor RsiW
VVPWRPSLDIHKDSGGYVLHALSDSEHVAFERHLPRCPPCVTEVDEFRRTIVHLACDIDITPPARLRSHLFALATRRSMWKIPRSDQSNRA